MKFETNRVALTISSCILLAVFAGGREAVRGQDDIALAPRVARPLPLGQQLGSLDHKPTADRPVGWRGDWTGRFPAATPPAQWSRRVKGLTTDLKYQGIKPTAREPGAESHPLEYFTLKEWLVAGPFDVADPVKDIDKDFLGGEDQILPAKDAKAGNATWKHLRVGMGTQSLHYHNEGTCGDSNVDFVYVYGNLPESWVVGPRPTSLNNKAAYAHTYIHAPEAGEVMLRVNYTAAAVKVFLNGQTVAVRRGEAVKVALKQGWNRLLVKAASSEAGVPEGQNAWVSRWRFAAYIEPVLPISYATDNVAWMTKMTGRSMSQPVVVGDRIFLGSGMTDLLCIDKKTGKVLWLQSNTPYDAMTDAERADAKIKEQIEPLAAKLSTLNDETVGAINAAISPVGLSSDQQANLDRLLKSKSDAERAVHDAFKNIDRKKYPQMYINEVSSSNAVPVSDGKYVYWVCGGGMKGPGSHVAACFDLAGKRVWSWHDGGSLGSQEHGNHISPNLIEGKFIYAANTTLIALDAKTGKELWRNSPDDWQNGLGTASPVAVKIGNAHAIVENRYIHRASDGKVICPSKLDISSCLTPIAENGVVFNPARWRGFKDPYGFIAVNVSAIAAPGGKAETVLELDGKDVTMPIRMNGGGCMVASPLYVNGIVYAVETGGGLTAVNLATGKALFRQYLDGYSRYNRYVYGVTASPALAGKHIYITDDAGYTHILQPGPQLKQVGRNVLENIHLGGHGGNPCKQESFYTSPWFEGKCMYLRGEEYLYCIGEQK